MSLSQRLFEEQKKVMKAQDKLRLNLIRGLRSELKYAEIAKKEPLCEEEMGKVMKALMPAIKGKADGSLVKKIAENLLGKTWLIQVFPF